MPNLFENVFARLESSVVANVVENRQFDVFGVFEFRTDFFGQKFDGNGKVCEDV
jgi:hypothetical protein